MEEPLVGEMKSEDVLPDAMFQEETLGDVQKANPMEVEDGEIVVADSQNGVILGMGDDANTLYQGSRGTIYKSKKKKKKRRNKSNSEPNLKDIDRFVSDVCKRLKERKSYMVYMAVGCLGVSAMNQLVKEVYAVQACGGQKTSDGKHFRSGGGILWDLLKSKDHNAYKYVLKSAKKFEKQFRSVRSVRKDAGPAPFVDQTEVSKLNKVVPSGNTNKVVPCQKRKIRVFPARKNKNHASSKVRSLTMNQASVDEITRGGDSEALELETRVQSQFEHMNLQKPLSPIPEEDAGSISDDLELESHVRNQLELMHIDNSAHEMSRLPVTYDDNLLDQP